MRDVGGVLNRNNQSKNFTHIVWECELCRETLGIPFDSKSYLQFEYKKCPRCSAEYNATSIVLFNN